jgi:hypothetical protein
MSLSVKMMKELSIHDKELITKLNNQSSTFMITMKSHVNYCETFVKYAYKIYKVYMKLFLSKNEVHILPKHDVKGKISNNDLKIIEKSYVINEKSHSALKSPNCDHDEAFYDAVSLFSECSAPNSSTMYSRISRVTTHLIENNNTTSAITTQILRSNLTHIQKCIIDYNDINSMKDLERTVVQRRTTITPRPNESMNFEVIKGKA